MRTGGMNPVLIAMLFFMMSGPAWALPVNTDIEILNRGPGTGFNYSLIHSANCSRPLCMSGSVLYGRDFEGTLNGDLDNVWGPLTLSNIRGTLSSTQGNIQFTGGFLNGQDDGFATGQLHYNFLSGSLQGESGTFYFLSSQLCCSSAPFGGPNHLTSEGFTLWGNNWDITANGGLNSRQALINAGFTPLGIDLVGGNYTTPSTTATPEPTSILLFGSGILGLVYLRKNKKMRS